jgi:hypothetical protein
MNSGSPAASSTGTDSSWIQTISPFRACSR